MRRTPLLVLLLPLMLPLLLLFTAGIVLTMLQSLGYMVPGGAAAAAEGGRLFAYRSVLGEPWFASSLRYSLFIAAVSSVLSVTAGTVLALGIWGLPAPARNLSIVYKIPLILPHISVSFLFLLLFSRSGLIASIVFRLGLIPGMEGFPDLLYGGTGTGIIAAYLYKETPFVTLLVLAVLINLDPRQVSAARMLGGSSAMVFRRVILPHIAPAMNAALIILFLYSFGAFDVPFILGGSAPSMLSIRVFDLFFRKDLASRPYAMAILVLMFLFSSIFIIIYSRIASHLQGKERKL